MIVGFSTFFSSFKTSCLAFKRLNAFLSPKSSPPAKALSVCVVAIIAICEDFQESNAG